MQTNSPSGRSGRHVSRAAVRLRVACVAAVGVIAIAGCGGTSKPAYCTNRANLENSIKGLTSLDVSSGLSGLKSQLTKIQSDAKALVNSAKSDFPTETSAITSSIDALSSTVRSLPSNPSAPQIATVATDVTNVISAVKSFSDASKSKCS